MNNFTFYMPTEIAFGAGAEEKTGRLIKSFGGGKVLIVYGSGSAVRSGLIDRVKGFLQKEDIVYSCFGGVSPNPVLSHAREGVKAAIKFGADFILAVGGGSSIDTAKAIAAGAANPEIDIWKFWTREEELSCCLPVGVVLTLSAAGSETSDSSVLTNEENLEKRGLSSNWFKPSFCTLNPELCFTVPPYQLACGVVDIMMHTIDRYFTPTKGNNLTDKIAHAVLRTAIEYGEVIVKKPADYQAQSEIMWAGSLSHNGLTGLGRAFDFPVHQLSHIISAKYGAAHGAALSSLYNAWAQYVYESDYERFAYFAHNVWHISGIPEALAAKEGIRMTVQFFKSISMPVCLPELNIHLTEADIDDLAERTLFFGKRTFGLYKTFTKDDIKNIYRHASRPLEK